MDLLTSAAPGAGGDLAPLRVPVSLAGFDGSAADEVRGWLEGLGFAISEWEDARIAHREKRPARRYYRITREGEEALAAALERYRSLAPVDLPIRAQPRTT